MPLTRLLSTRLLSAGLLLALLAACSQAGSAVPPRHLSAYADDAQLNQALQRWRAEAAKRRSDLPRQTMAAGNVAAPALAMAPAAPAAPAAAKVAEAAPAADGITNVQTAGVDEGGIVKRAGDFLVVLRRGRLFTVRVGGDALQPSAMVDAYAPGSDPQGAWYDEMLVSGRTVVVIGYSYQRGGTEIGLFDLDARGGLAYRATYHLRSYDYYSARNYASRLIGRQLIFYSPMLLQPYGQSPLQALPSVRRWTGAADASWQRILPATRIFRSDDDFDPMQPLALHTITRCDIGDAELRCESSAVLGPAGRVFYVSQGSVYVWTAGRAPGRSDAQSVLFRLPLDGAPPTGIKTVGVPIDQLSFLEDAGGHLNVLLRAQGRGEGMWGAHALQGDSALLRLPLDALGDGRGAAALSHYRSLGPQQPMHNRFVGDWLLTGGGQGAWALRYADATLPVQNLQPGHGVERIEALGAHAVLVGNAGANLHFTAVRLGRDGATLAGRHVQAAARQGESRSHGFFYRPTAADEGLLGLPMLEAPAPGMAVYQGVRGAASVLFLRDKGLDFRPLGSLRSQAAAGNDSCKASCVDWYGNARPLFVGDRVFALMGYELVEGRLEGQATGERLVERRRAHFGPAPAIGGRASPFQP